MIIQVTFLFRGISLLSSLLRMGGSLWVYVRLSYSLCGDINSHIMSPAQLACLSSGDIGVELRCIHHGGCQDLNTTFASWFIILLACTKRPDRYILVSIVSCCCYQTVLRSPFFIPFLYIEFFFTDSNIFRLSGNYVTGNKLPPHSMFGLDSELHSR